MMRSSRLKVANLGGTSGTGFKGGWIGSRPDTGTCTSASEPLLTFTGSVLIRTSKSTLEWVRWFEHLSVYHAWSCSDCKAVHTRSLKSMSGSILRRATQQRSNDPIELRERRRNMIRAGFSQLHIMAGLDVACGREPDHGGAGGASRGDATDAVLDHDAIAGRDAELFRRVQEDVGMRFAAGDVRGTEHPPLEQRCHVQHLKAQRQPLGRGRGGNAVRHLAPNPQKFLEKFPRAVDRFQTRAKGIERPPLISVSEIGRQLAADHSLDGLDHVRKPLAHEGAVGVVYCRRLTEFGDDFSDDRVGQHLAVGKDAVEIENDRAVVRVQPRTQLRTQFPGVQGW